MRSCLDRQSPLSRRGDVSVSRQTRRVTVQDGPGKAETELYVADVVRWERLMMRARQPALKS